jgi:hypothetical protein
MESLALLGAVAAAQQLAEISIKLAIFLWELQSNVRNIPSNMDTRISQIKHLVSLVQRIIANPLLQTESMALILSECVQHAKQLLSTLQCLRIPSHSWVTSPGNAILLAKRNKEINMLFRHLKRHQHVLGMCISEGIW